MWAAAISTIVGTVGQTASAITGAIVGKDVAKINSNTAIKLAEIDLAAMDKQKELDIVNIEREKNLIVGLVFAIIIVGAFYVLSREK
jgi:uncharacterized membrane protein